MSDTPLPYFYGYSIIKCKHLRARKLGTAAGNKPVIAGNHQHLIASTDLRIRENDMPGKRILSLCHKPSYIITDSHPVAGGGKECLEVPCPLDAKCQSPISCSKSGKAHSPVQDLADPAGRREDKLASFREEAIPDIPPKLVISDDLNPAQRTVLRVSG
jgi:hypothetical protein